MVEPMWSSVRRRILKLPFRYSATTKNEITLESEKIKISIA